jgi:hypothetical protein
MMKSLFGGAILGVLAIATGANAAVVTANYSGVMTYTAAEATGAPWGYDAWGNYVVGDAYSATIVYNTSAGTTVDYPGGEQLQDQRPGFATESFTIAGHTYYSAGSAISYYDRSPNFIEFNISYSPGDFGGQYFEAITLPGVTISPSLNDPLSLTAADFDPTTTGGNVVVPGGSGGALYGDYDIEKLEITVTAPEPSTWALTLMGFAAAGLLYSRNARAALV